MKKIFLLQTIFLAMLLILGACGFKPMYGSAAQSSNQIIKSIQIANIPDRNGQFLRNILVDRLNSAGTPQAPEYRLEIKNIKETIQDLDLTVRSDTTREQMRMRASMRLIDIRTGEALVNKTISAIGSYNVLENEYNSRISRQDLREDLLNKLALQAERAIAISG